MCGVFAPIQHRQTLIDRLRIEVITETVLIGQFVAQGIVAISIGTAKH